MILKLLLSVALAATSNAPSRAVVSVSDSLSTSDDLENACSLGCAIGWDVSVSSYAAGHTGEHLDDSRLDTAWVASARDTRKPTVTFTFPREKFAGLSRVRFNGFLVIPGFSADERQWLAHGRPRRVVITWNGRQLAAVDLADKRVDQLVSFPAVFLKPGDSVVLTIRNVYPGDGGLPVAITEIVPQGPH